ncbi:MAG: anaerobic ribonucleoside-triphosphate reductase activating protein [Clostridia bacterium]
MSSIQKNMIKIAGVVKESIVDGPGIRYVVFTQGCPHNCLGCHNPETHDIQGGKLVSIDKIAEDINNNPLLKGVTISGGEPFMQAENVSNLIGKVNRDKLDVIVYSGYTFEDLIKKSDINNNFMDLINNTDVLIDGKFEEELKSQKLKFRGSLNQRAIDIKESLSSGKTVLYDF